MISWADGVEAGQINQCVGATSPVERYAGHIGYDAPVLFRGRRYAACSVVLLVVGPPAAIQKT
jgi:predicted acetyltransferase